MKKDRPALAEDEIKSVLGFGGGMRIDGTRYTTDSLKAFAGYAKASGARLTLTGMHNRTADDLKAIAGFGGGTVSFEFGEDD